jgi:hypothetical protein
MHEVTHIGEAGRLGTLDLEQHRNGMRTRYRVTKEEGVMRPTDLRARSTLRTGLSASLSSSRTTGTTGTATLRLDGPPRLGWADERRRLV